jgi:hypothetical protein
VVSAPADVKPAIRSAEHTSRHSVILRHLRLLVLPVAAVALWASSLPDINPHAMNDLGLVSVLPRQTWLSFALLAIGFLACLRRADRATWPLLLHVVLLVVMLYGIPALVTHEPSGPVAFRHSGITDNLLGTGIVNTRIDAYFSWPGFFIGLGTLVKLAGVQSALTFATWATVVFNLLYLPPLLLLARALTRDPRLVWGTIWVFYSANWINQDYLAPQAFAYLLYLTILALLLTYLRPRDTRLEGAGWFERRFSALLRVRTSEIPPQEISRWTSAAIVAVVVLLYTVTVASHQLTPFAIFLSVAALVAVGQCTARGLPWLMAVILTLWFIFVAHGYIAGHLPQLLGSVGNLSRDTSANITARIAGSHLHMVVVHERLLLSGALWLLALLGAIRRFRGGHADHAAAVLCVAPLLLFILQPYGGEMLMRIYFFMLPFVAFFATAALLPSDASVAAARARVSAALRLGATATVFGLMVATLPAGGLLARYGNERADYFTEGERAAISYLYAHARPHAPFAVEKTYLPWKYREYAQHKYLSLEWMLTHGQPPTPAQAFGRISNDLRPVPWRPAGYVILTRSQRAYVEMLGGVLSPSYLDEFERMLRESPKFRLVYSNPSAKIYVRLPG